MPFYQSFTNPANVWTTFNFFNWISTENGKGKILVLQIVWPFTIWNRFVFIVFPLFEEKMSVHRHEREHCIAYAWKTLSRNATCHVYWKINIQLESINTTKQEYYNVQTNDLPKRYCINLWE